EEGLTDMLKRWTSGGFGHPPMENETAEAKTEPSASGETKGTPEGHATGDAGVSAVPENSERARSIPGSEIYFSLYFAMTGTHALHMIVGMGVMLWLLKNAK